MRACVHVSRLQTDRQEGHNGATLRVPSSPFFLPFFLLRETLCPLHSLFTFLPFYFGALEYIAPSTPPPPPPLLIFLVQSPFSFLVSRCRYYLHDKRCRSSLQTRIACIARIACTLDPGEGYHCRSAGARPPKFRRWWRFLFGDRVRKKISRKD